MAYAFSASSMERAVACPASVALPATYVLNEHAARGTAIHRFIARVLRGMPIVESLAIVPREWRDTCKGIRIQKELDSISIRDIRVEEAYAVDAETGAVRPLGSGIERKYVVQPGEIPGSLDIEGTGFLGHPIIVDWKAGYQEVTEVASNLQLLFYAYCVARTRGADRVDVYIAHIRNSGFIRWSNHTFTTFDFDAFEELLQKTYRRAQRAIADVDAVRKLKVVRGDHCQFCPAMSACPAYTSLVRAMLSDIESMASKIEVMTPEEKGEAFDKLAAIKRLVKYTDEVLKDFARQHPYPLPDGRWVREVPHARSSFSEEKAVDLLRELGATEEQIQSCETTITVRPVRAVKPKVGRRAA